MYRHFVKRLLDILFSLIGMPFLLLAILIVGPMIWLSDHGSIFYVADRRGYKGKIFKMFKFRSMKMNAPLLRNADGSAYTGSDDPRVTKIGRILRKTSVDELPQLINVLKGDMSLVGPRPTLTGGKYEDLDMVGKKRLEARPGITGYTQAYFRNSISQEEKFRLDCEYADRLSLGLDLKILFKTICSVMKAENVNATQSVAARAEKPTEKKLTEDGMIE
jgi:lipopolysaccharide/colanic/teichoic acid biosynthesis glycosyltransferase